MDIATTAGAEPFEADCDGGRTQQWELLVDRGAQQVRLRNYATGMCLRHSGTQADGAPVRQDRAACTSTESTARWTYFPVGNGNYNFAQPDDTGYILGLDDWWDAGEGNAHDPDIGTSMNYYGTTSMQFRYTGDAFGG